MRNEFTVKARVQAMLGDDDINKIILLRETSLFAKLPSEVLYAIAKITLWKEFVDGETIFHAGDPGMGLYIIANGSVLITSKNVERIQLDKYNYFGEIALLSSNPRTATAIAKDNCMLLFIQREYFEDIVFNFPEVPIELLQQLIGYISPKNHVK